MAGEKQNQADKVATTSGSDSMAAARAARGKTRRATSELNPNQKFALRTIQQARSGLKRAQDNLILGMAVPADLIDACAKVNSAIGQMLFD